MSIKTSAKRATRIGLAAATAVASLSLISLSGAADASQGQAQAQNQGKGAPPSKTVNASEEARGKAVAAEKVQKEAKPHPAPEHKGNKGGNGGNGNGGPQDNDQQGPDGPQERVDGAVGSVAAGDVARSENTLADSAAGGNDQGYSSNGTAQNSAWPYSYYSNPNLQVGKLYFDTQPGPGERWSWCSATAVNSENKSLLLTAGHCVFRPDPDGDGRIQGNGFWYEHFQFCPGYEYGCRLGVWNYRTVSTTWSWYGGVNGYYDFRDDVAVLLMHPNSRGHLVNYVGGHGISFNEPTNLYRWAFGYPASDSRWPNYSYSGEDLIYCGNQSYNDGTYAGTMWMNCTMTGGSSGGPWLTYVQSNWLGYVNSVNSHKPYGGPWMSGPYFGSQESSLFNYWRNR